MLFRSIAACIFGLTLILAPLVSSAAETPVIQKPGLTGIQLVSDSESIAPGETITVGVLIQPMAGYHTYWRGPGIVGVATHLDWELPEGFSAGEIQWPAPEQTTMAGINAYGYKSKTCLLVDITAPAEIEGDSVTLRTRCGWMACAKTCHPSWSDFSLTLPVNRSGKASPKEEKWTKTFEESRSRFPKVAPESWKLSLEDLAEETFSLTLELPGEIPSPASDLYFYSYDLQVNSDEPQVISPDADGRRATLRFTRPEFAPENPEILSGVLFHPAGWPGLDTKWVEIEAAWNPESASEDD